MLKVLISSVPVKPLLLNAIDELVRVEGLEDSLDVLEDKIREIKIEEITCSKED